MTTRVTLTPDELAGGQALGAYVKAQDELDAACRHLERMEIERPDGIGKAEWRMHRALRRRNRAYAAYRAAWDAAQAAIRAAEAAEAEGGER